MMRSSRPSRFDRRTSQASGNNFGLCDGQQDGQWGYIGVSVKKHSLKYKLKGR